MHQNGHSEDTFTFQLFSVMQKECYWALTAHPCRICEINIKNNSFTNVMTLAHNSDLFFPSYNEFYIFRRNFPAEQFNICINQVSLKNKRFKQNIGRLNRLRWVKRVISNFLKTNTTAEAVRWRQLRRLVLTKTACTSSALNLERTFF